jgi:hypothetical protein
MSEAESYRTNLAMCWRMAEKASDELEKRTWLEMAESWRLLVISDCAISSTEDFAVVSQNGERDGGPCCRHAYRRPATAVLERPPVWIVAAVSCAAHLASSVRSFGMPRWSTLATLMQERSAHNLRNMWRWFILLTRQ